MSKRLNWDDPLELKDKSEWLEIIRDLMKINNVEISRRVSGSFPRKDAKHILVYFL